MLNAGGASRSGRRGVFAAAAGTARQPGREGGVPADYRAGSESAYGTDASLIPDGGITLSEQARRTCRRVAGAGLRQSIQEDSA